ncbi:hypothetical protein PRK78_006580 [Emydomyces testavorans]|uniref:Uncharacterized protein n=1 Tax=Emydomyces testavorans TaxID=2070801 RepID=A0AAF0ILU0_9EURO|nr:hypothetical protein PRK78_006580 [Emydomyces testavorans]
MVEFLGCLFIPFKISLAIEFISPIEEPLSDESEYSKDHDNNDHADGSQQWSEGSTPGFSSATDSTPDTDSAASIDEVVVVSIKQQSSSSEILVLTIMTLNNASYQQFFTVLSGLLKFTECEDTRYCNELCAPNKTVDYEELATAEVLASLPSYTHCSVNEGNSPTTVPAMGHGMMALPRPTPEINSTAPHSLHNPFSYIPTPTAAEPVQEIGSDDLQGTAGEVISRFEQVIAMQQSSSPGFATVISHSPNNQESAAASTNSVEHVSNNTSKHSYTENNAHENLKQR